MHRGIWIALCAGLSACGHGVTEPPEPVTDAEIAAFEGCRGPNDPGCAECQAAPNDFWSAQPESDNYDRRSGGARCEPSCPACARCSYEEEREAREVTWRRECLPCEDPGLDPCFAPTSCGCFCSRHKQLSEDCAALVP